MLLNCPVICVGELFSLLIFLISPSHTVTVTGLFCPAPGHFEIGGSSPSPGRALFHFGLIF